MADDDDVPSRTSLLSMNQSAQLASGFLEEVIEVDTNSHPLWSIKQLLQLFILSHT